MTARQKGIWVAIGVTTVAAIVLGCGGSGDGGQAAPTGKAAVRSSSLAGYQSLAGGVAYPFTAIKATAPGGKLIVTYTKQANTLMQIPALGLYATPLTAKGKTEEIDYFTDAAGTHPCGSMVLTSSSGTFGNYAKYPVTINVNVSVTAGNLPCKGSCNVVFTSATGSNDLKGTLNLTRNQESVSIDLQLDQSENVTGKIDISENSTLIHATNVTGKLSGDIHCDFTLDPQGYKGTGILNLTTGNMALTFTDPANASSHLDSNGNLVIDYPDGSHETIDNPLSAPLLASGGGSATGTSATATGTTATATGTTATGTTATGTTATGTTATATGTTATGTTGGSVPYTLGGVLPGNPSSVNDMSPAGHLVGQTGDYFHQVPSYWATASSNPIALKLPAGVNHQTVTGVNDSGQAVGYAYDANGGTIFLYWASPTAAATMLPTPSSIYPALYGTTYIGIQKSGVIFATEQGTMQSSSQGAFTMVYKSGTDKSPSILPGGFATAFSDTAIAGVGAVNGDSHYLVWTAPTTGAQPQTLPLPVSPSIKYLNMGKGGAVVLSDYGTVLVHEVVGPSYSQDVVLQAPNFTRINGLGAHGVGPTGHILGEVMHTSSSVDDDGLIWLSPSAKPIDLKSSATPNVSGAWLEDSAGALVVAVWDANAKVNRFHLMTPK